MLAVKEPRPKVPVSVVVETPVESVESVLYAKPRVVGGAPPIAVMLPNRLANDGESEFAESVVTVGAAATVIEFTVNVPDVVNV